MKTALCSIAKLENKYIYEWVQYHIDLGFSHVFIYDNNDIDGETISSVFEDSAIKEYVTIVDFRGKSRMQLKAYNDCYQTYEYDWFAFIDVDEFISFNPESGIKRIDQFLNRFQDSDAVVLNWKCFGDCNEIVYRPGSVFDRFQTPILPLDFVASLTNGLPENYHVKCIIRSGINIDWEAEHYPSPNPHVPAGLNRVCNAVGAPVNDAPWQKPDYQISYISHFITMSIEEYLRKIKRGAADTGSKNRYGILRFFRYNVITFEKLRFIKKATGSVPLLGIINERFKWKSITYKWPTMLLYKSFRHSRI